uniref:Transposase n=1 Tax=Caenorhabditis tropicalis TaxID=1561998 RepID=A0A1I7T9T0_9PELO
MADWPISIDFAKVRKDLQYGVNSFWDETFIFRRCSAEKVRAEEYFDDAIDDDYKKLQCLEYQVFSSIY